MNTADGKCRIGNTSQIHQLSVLLDCSSPLTRCFVEETAVLVQGDKANSAPAAGFTPGLSLNPMLPLHTPSLQGPALRISLTAVQFLNIQTLLI